MSGIICPTCKQDLRAQPHEGWRGEDCPQCGQGLQWRFAARLKRAKKVSQRTLRGRRPSRSVKPSRLRR